MLPLLDEFIGADFCDARLSSRLLTLVSDLATDPSRSFPDASGDSAALEGTYRFLGNERVTPARVLGPHMAQTRRRAGEHERVLVVHDTTELTFRGDREGLGMLSNQSRGLFAHTSMVVSADGERTPLGVIGLAAYVRAESSGRQRPRGRPEEELETWRWWLGVEAAEAQLDAVTQPIHVMDREADITRLLARMTAAGKRFIVRSRFDRHLDATYPDTHRLRRRLALTEELFLREVPLSARSEAGNKTSRRRPGDLARHPPRDTRIAKLAFGAARVRLRGSTKADGAKAEALASFEVNVVWVHEVDPPEGQAPIDWILLTSEPVGTIQEIEFVVDAYRARWTIEEYFKALKSGCAIERRQLVTKAALLNALAVFAPIAWRLLLLRTEAQRTTVRPASAVVSDLELTLLARRPKSKLPAEPTARDVMLEIARYGGHLKRNGEPGWITLGRGFEKLLTLAEGARIALGAM